jgi:hypothetical protein
MLSRNSSLSNAKVRDILCSTADDLGPTGWDEEYGYGLVNAYKAVIAAGGTNLPPGKPGIPDGSNYQWAVWCNDTSGLTNITENRTLNIDNTAPAITSTNVNTTIVYENESICVNATVYTFCFKTAVRHPTYP